MRVLTVMLILLVSLPAYAEEPLVGASPRDFIDLATRAAERDRFAAENEVLRAKLAIAEERDKLHSEIEALKEQKYKLQVELTEIAEQSAAAWKKEAESAHARAASRVKIATVQSYAAIGFSAGLVAAPLTFGLAPLIGAGIGAAIGLLVP